VKVHARSYRPWALSFAAALLAGGLGCSFLLKLEPDQCATSKDCQDKGGGFSKLICVSGSCVKPAVPDASDNDAQPADQPCTTNVECTVRANDQPSICLDESSKCAPLKLAGVCPVVVDDINEPGPYTKEEAIIVGALLDIEDAAPLRQASVASIVLAFRELQALAGGGGIPGSTLSEPRRPIVGVLCKRDAASLEAAQVHLFDTLGVRAVIAHLKPEDLIAVYDRWKGKKPFIFNPGYSNPDLAGKSVTSGGRLWHAIGSVTDTVPTYVPLVKQLEDRMKTVDLPSATDIKVALLTSNNQSDANLSSELKKVIRINGKGWDGNGPLVNEYNYNVGDKARYATIGNDIAKTFKPHIIIVNGRTEALTGASPGLTGEVPPGIAKVIEDNWVESWRPYYVLQNELAPENDPALSLQTFLATRPVGTNKRFLGVAIESPPDKTLRNAYDARLKSAFPGQSDRTGRENFYDTAYALFYAMYASSSDASPSGEQIAEGMKRIMSGSVLVDVGSEGLAQAFSKILFNVKNGGPSGAVKLNGTMGPWDWEPEKNTYARLARGSVYCLREKTQIADAGVDNFAYQSDVYRYNSATKELQEPQVEFCYPASGGKPGYPPAASAGDGGVADAGGDGSTDGSVDGSTSDAGDGGAGSPDASGSGG
jgi:hypothetical protein